MGRGASISVAQQGGTVELPGSFPPLVGLACGALRETVHAASDHAFGPVGDPLQDLTSGAGEPRALQDQPRLGEGVHESVGVADFLRTQSVHASPPAPPATRTRGVFARR